MSNLEHARNEYSKIRSKEAQNKKFYEREDGVAAPPHTLCLSVNNNCYMTCKMCDIGTYNRSKKKHLHKNLFSSQYVQKRKPYNVPINILKGIVDELAPHKTSIKTNFVEPLLYKDLQNLARHIKERNLKFYTITNGWMLKKNADWLVEYCDLIRVSLDGVAQVHDSIRGKKDSFVRSLSGIKDLIEKKKKLNSNKPIIGLCFTISNFNYFNLVEFMDYLDKEGILSEVYVNFNHLLYLTDWEILQSKQESPLFNDLKCSSIDNIIFEELDTVVLKEQIETLSERYPQDLYHYYFSPWLTSEDIAPYYDPNQRMFPNVPCYLPWHAAQLDIEGNVTVYGHCILPSMGNAFKDGFLNVWNSPRAREIRLKLKEHASFAGCNKCIGTLYPLRGRG